MVWSVNVWNLLEHFASRKIQLSIVNSVVMDEVNMMNPCDQLNSITKSALGIFPLSHNISDCIDFYWIYRLLNGVHTFTMSTPSLPFLTTFVSFFSYSFVPSPPFPNLRLFFLLMCFFPLFLSSRDTPLSLSLSLFFFSLSFTGQEPDVCSSNYSFSRLLTHNSWNNSPFSHNYKHNLKTTHQLAQTSNFQVKTKYSSQKQNIFSQKQTLASDDAQTCLDYSTA